MTLLGLELTDVGILAAAEGFPALLSVDGADKESPGFAIPAGASPLVGREAEARAHVQPLQFNNRFWDELDTEPLKQRFLHFQNHAEIACAHLSQIWQNIKAHGDALIIAAPAYLRREQLGLVLSITEELSIPLRGIVSLPIAASGKPYPDRILLHLDIHLHRLEVTFMEQNERLTQQETVTSAGKGLHFLYSEWVQSIADEFIRTTRFDPLHVAASEQELHNVLPGILAALEQNPSMAFEMASGSKTHGITLNRDLFLSKSEEVYWEIRRLIAGIRARNGKPGQAATVQFTHRISRLPACRQMLEDIPGVELVELKPGAGAMGALHLSTELPPRNPGASAPFLVSRLWQKDTTPFFHHPGHFTSGKVETVRPTHLLYRSLAYPISATPLVICPGKAGEEPFFLITGKRIRTRKSCCSVRLEGHEVVLTGYYTSNLFVDEQRISGRTLLRTGQVIRVGNPGETFQLIACLQEPQKDDT